MKLYTAAQHLLRASLALTFVLLSSATAPATDKEASGPAVVGKPVAIKFKAVDGKEIDLAKMQGKVVLVDFWATWCGPCVAEMPHVKQAYEKLNGKGFEIVGISFDKKKESLDYFLKKEQIKWPQYFDGRGWGNKIGERFGIESIPTMWLIDKKGNLRDLHARSDLVGKVEKLLAE